MRINEAFEKYDPRLGYIAMKKWDRWWVVSPEGRFLRAGDEATARAEAAYRNLRTEAPIIL